MPIISCSFLVSVFHHIVSIIFSISTALNISQGCRGLRLPSRFIVPSKIIYLTPIFSIHYTLLQIAKIQCLMYLGILLKNY